MLVQITAVCVDRLSCYSTVVQGQFKIIDIKICMISSSFYLTQCCTSSFIPCMNTITNHLQYIILRKTLYPQHPTQFNFKFFLLFQGIMYSTVTQRDSGDDRTLYCTHTHYLYLYSAIHTVQCYSKFFVICCMYVLYIT